MITHEIRQWLKKVERNQYSYNDALEEFMRFMPVLTQDEMKTIKRKLENSYK